MTSLASAFEASAANSFQHHREPIMDLECGRFYPHGAERYLWAMVVSESARSPQLSKKNKQGPH